MRNSFDRAECLRSTAAIAIEIRRLTEGLRPGHFHAPTRTGGWSIGYCMEHLILAGNALLLNWDSASHIAGDGRSFPYSWWQRALLLWVQNPSLMKRRTPPALAPYSRHSIEETLQQLLRMHAGLAYRLDSSGTLDLQRTKITIPTLPAVRCSLGFACDLSLSHERRHLAQAWRIRRQIEQS
ncbi:MAG: DinB family protein [Bryobacteraceae bacterium]